MVSEITKAGVLDEGRKDSEVQQFFFVITKQKFEYHKNVQNSLIVVLVIKKKFEFHKMCRPL